MLKRISILTNELPPYRRPIFELLGQRRDIEAKVLLSTSIEQGRQWDEATNLPHVEVEIVRNLTARYNINRRDIGTSQTRLIHFPIGVFPSLIRFQPSVVISSEFGFRSMLAWLYCRLWRASLIIWSEDTPHHAKGASIFQRHLRCFLAKRANGFIAWGIQAEHYLHSLNILPSKVTYCAQAVDNDYWSSSIETDRRQVRDNLELKGKIVLYVGSLIPRKGLEYLIKVWAASPDLVQGHNTLLIVGGGEQETTLKQLVEKSDAKNVIFTGPIPRENLRKYYAVADLFVFPTLLDVWGLVVNEAMAVGIPVLCSRFAGCAYELIIEGVTGNTFDPDDTNEFASLITHWLLEGPKIPVKHIQHHIKQWNFKDCERSIKLAIDKALGYPI